MGNRSTSDSSQIYRPGDEDPAGYRGSSDIFPSLPPRIMVTTLEKGRECEGWEEAWPVTVTSRSNDHIRHSSLSCLDALEFGEMSESCRSREHDGWKNRRREKGCLRMS